MKAPAMTDITHSIDPSRPWIGDPRDDLGQMNWWAILFNPFGTSPKLHFTRAWTLMFMARFLSAVIPLLAMWVITMAGGDSSGLIWLFIPAAIIFPLTILTSFIAHMRRLADGRKPVILAGLVLLPLMLGFGGFLANGYMALAMSKAAESAKTVVAEEPDSDGMAASGTAVSETTASEGAGAKKKRAGAERHKPSPRQMAQGGMAIGGVIWWLSSIAIMIWSLTYVARIPNGGEGRFTTESVAQDSFS